MGQAGIPVLFLAELCNFPRLAFITDNQELVTCLGHTRKTLYLDRAGWPGCLDRITGVVDHGPYAASFMPDQHNIAIVELTLLYQDSRNGPPPPIKACLYNHSGSRAVFPGMKLKILRLQCNGLQ